MMNINGEINVSRVSFVSLVQSVEILRFRHSFFHGHKLGNRFIFSFLHDFVFSPEDRQNWLDLSVVPLNNLCSRKVWKVKKNYRGRRQLCNTVCCEMYNSCPIVAQWRNIWLKPFKNLERKKKIGIMYMFSFNMYIIPSTRYIVTKH